MYEYSLPISCQMLSEYFRKKTMYVLKPPVSSQSYLSEAHIRLDDACSRYPYQGTGNTESGKEFHPIAICIMNVEASSSCKLEKYLP